MVGKCKELVLDSASKSCLSFILSRRDSNIILSVNKKFLVWSHQRDYAHIVEDFPTQDLICSIKFKKRLYNSESVYT